VQQGDGALAGLRIRSASDLPATFTLEGSDVSLHTVNATTADATTVTGFNTQRGGVDRAWDRATLASSAARADLDFLVLPLEGQTPPTVALSSRSLGLAAPDRDELAEDPYVDSSRPVLRGGVAGTALATSASVDEMEVTGAFALSVWSWNFTAASAAGNESFPTGVHRSSAVRDPVTGQVVTATAFKQVAQVQVGSGTLRIAGLAAASVAAYSPSLSVSSVGRFSLSHAVGLLDAGGAGHLAGQDLAAQGTLASTAEGAGGSGSGGGVRVDLRSFEGTMTVAGRPVDLGPTGALRQAGAAAGGGLSLPALSWGLGLGASLAAVALAILLAKGPARRARFNRIEGRFDARDYRGVLQRIEPFTGRRRYRRRASLLKAVSLISLQDYREAALYLEALDPARGPDAATKAFLQACAAAGQDQDDVVLRHLSECFRLDPSYIREARFVPILAGYLPYFSLSPEFA
jgi:hypothetical protein